MNAAKRRDKEVVRQNYGWYYPPSSLGRLVVVRGSTTYEEQSLERLGRMKNQRIEAAIAAGKMCKELKVGDCDGKDLD